uniref:Small ribosomal subunit protein eS1 n=1 Tax=Dermatophagoides pteronyssinus TaxID=6956 RepID=A0A6P6YKI5_DERPT|nr:40S ribosomal protein S3a-like [Dermatophagoides pteronyssinus]
MAIGKNRRISKGGKKGSKKKTVDTFARKEHYVVKAPSYFHVSNIANTMASRSQGLKKSEDSLRGRTFDINLADLQKNEGQSHRKIKLICEEVQGRNCYTDFHGLSVTRDYLCAQIRRHHSLIEAYVDVQTVDRYQLRMFCIAFTKSVPGQMCVNCYAKTSQQKVIRSRMVKYMQQEASKCTLKELVKKLIPEGISKKIEKLCSSVYPVHNVSIYKVKVVKKPKLDVAKLMEHHSTAAVAGELKEAKNLLSADVVAES